jgi:hypothetical protein
MPVCFSSAATPVKTKWSLAIAACRGSMAFPPVIWLKVWMEKGAVPSEAGRRSAYTRSVAPGATTASLSTRCAQTICSVLVSLRAVTRSGHTISGARRTDSRNSRRPTAKMPPVWRISSSLAVRGTGV